MQHNKIVKKVNLFQVALFLGVLAGLLLPGMGWLPVQAGEGEIEHPMMKPAHYTDKEKCPNCGMVLNMWARTRHAFSNSEGEFETCSLHCLADISMRSDEQPRNVRSALFTAPEKMIPAADAFYVVGSSMPGTMTMKSKLVFASEKEAGDFIASKGGTVSSFSAAYEMAFKELEMSRSTIDARRKKTGKIQEPAETEACTVCGMYPYRYPKHRSQILTMDKKTLHFCSNRCLVNYRANPAQYLDNPPKEMFTWVTIYPEGIYEYAGGLFYVVGSGVHGPMGLEALPFRTRAEAGAFAAKEGGKVMRFEEITPDMLQGGHGHGMKMKM